MNVGAENKEDSGLYFSWGNTEGHAEGSGYHFSQAEYDTTPGAAITTDLSLTQDAARVNLGAPWRMPTAAEFQELNENCNYIWTTINGILGMLLTSKVNGNTLFFPAAGYYGHTAINGRGEYGYYWSSSYISATNARDFRFDSSDINPLYDSSRLYGFPVRAVLNL